MQFQTLFTVKIRYRIRCCHQSLPFHCDCLAMNWKCPIWFKWMWFNQMIKPQIVSSHYINYLYLALDFSVLEIVFEVKCWKISTKILIEVLVFCWKIFILCTVIELKIHLIVNFRFNLPNCPAFSSRLAYEPFCTPIYTGCLRDDAHSINCVLFFLYICTSRNFCRVWVRTAVHKNIAPILLNACVNKYTKKDTAGRKLTKLTIIIGYLMWFISQKTYEK